MPVVAVERLHEYPYKVSLIIWECPTCGIVYGIPREFANEVRASGSHYYCPNGHHLSWTESDADREKKRADAAERRAANFEAQADYERERAAGERRTAAALRGHLTRMRNRIAAGVCPVPGCKRTGLTQTLNHIGKKHPEWLREHVHELTEA